MIHRHLGHRRLTLAALDDLLENGTLADWRPVLAKVRREPHGEVARRLDHLLEVRDYAETGALWRAYLRAARQRSAASSGSGSMAGTVIEHADIVAPLDEPEREGLR